MTGTQVVEATIERVFKADGCLLLILSLLDGAFSRMLGRERVVAKQIREQRSARNVRFDMLV